MQIAPTSQDSRSNSERSGSRLSPPTGRSGYRQVRHRVDDLVVDAQLEMEMWPGRVTRGSLEADLLSAHHLIAHHHPGGQEVAVQGRDAAPVGDDDKVAVADARVADGDDH